MQLRHTQPNGCNQVGNQPGCCFRESAQQREETATQTRLDGQRSFDDAILAARLAGVADAPAVPDQQVREPRPVVARHELHQVALDLHRILLLREAEPLREPAHVRVDDDPARIAELRRDDVRRLARNPRQPKRARRASAAPRRRTPRSASASCRARPSPSAGRSRSRRCRARAPPAAPRGNPRAACTSGRVVDVTRFTFTSVVCAESMTETSNSSSSAKRERDRRVGVLDREPLDHRLHPRASSGRPACAPPRRSYAALALSDALVRQPVQVRHPGADEVERRTARARELARPRPELAGVDARDRRPRAPLRAPAPPRA